MVYVPQPYIPSGGTPQQPNSPTRQPQGGYGTAATGSSGYAPAPAQSSPVYVPSSSSSGYSSAYGPPISTSSSTSGYAPASSGAYSSSGYHPSTTGTSGYAPTSSYSAPTSSAPTPDFSQALDMPPPAYAPAPAAYSPPASAAYSPPASVDSRAPGFKSSSGFGMSSLTSKLPTSITSKLPTALTSALGNAGGGGKPTTGYGGSNQPTTGYGGNNQPTTGYGGSNQPTTGYGGSNQPTTGYGGSNQQTTGYGGSNQPTMAYGGSNQPATAYGQPTTGYYGSDKPTDYHGSGYSTTASAVPLASNNYTVGPTGGLVSEGNPTASHKIDYEIKGHEMQIVEIELDPQETVIAEAGAMMYLEDGIDFKTKFGDGSTPKEGFFKKLLQAGGRLLMGESLFITHFTNIGHTKARAAFAAPYPGCIMPMNLQALGGSLICQKDGFLCAAKGTKLTVHFNKKIGSGLLGGEGFVLQKLSGDGLAFIHAGGTVIRRELRGEKLRIDTGCVVAFTEGINFDIEFVPGLKSMFFGGEGLNFAVLQGTGTVWMQSLPFSRLADRIIQNAPSIGGRRQDEGSALTGRYGDMANGDGFGFKF